MAANRIAVETWMHIAEYVDDERALAALMRVNHKTHQVCEPKVYRHAVKERLRDITFLAAAAGNLATLKLAKHYGATFGGIFPLVSPSKWVVARWKASMNDMFVERDMPDRTPGDAGWATPLHAAAKHGHYHVVEWLLAEKVDLEAPARFCCECLPLFAQDPLRESPPALGDYPAWTPLHFAICQGHSSVARLLLSAGASHSNLWVSESSGRWPDFHDYNSKYLLTRRASRKFYDGPNRSDGKEEEHVSAIHIAALVGNEPIMTHLVKNLGVDINSKDGGGAGPVHYAVMAPSVTTTTHVVNLGADVHLGYYPKTLKRWGEHRVIIPMCKDGPVMALHWALLWRKYEAVKQLAMKGACWVKEPDEDVSKTAWLKVLMESFSDGTSQQMEHEKMNFVEIFSGKNSLPRSAHSQLLMDNLQDFLPELVRLTWRGDLPLFSKGLDHRLSEIQNAFFCACQIADFREEALGHFKQGFCIIMELDPHQGLDATRHLRYLYTAAEKILCLHQDAYPTKVRCSFGTMALCFALSNMHRGSEGKIFQRVRWLLNAGARPTSSRQPFSPLICLFNRIRVDDAKYEGAFPHVKEENQELYKQSLFDFLPVIELLGENGAWTPFDDARNEGVLLVLAAYWGMIYQLKSTSSTIAGKFHRRVLEKMPRELRTMVEVGKSTFAKRGA